MDKSEALFLAQELEAPLGTVISGEVDRRAAAELRRLHAVNAELLEALKRTKQTGVFVGAIAQEMMDAAIARAEGEKT
jgi:hypothetical protein